MNDGNTYEEKQDFERNLKDYTPKPVTKRQS
jgi:hypothetical protein